MARLEPQPMALTQATPPLEEPQLVPSLVLSLEPAVLVEPPPWSQCDSSSIDLGQSCGPSPTRYCSEVSDARRCKYELESSQLSCLNLVDVV